MHHGIGHNNNYNNDICMINNKKEQLLAILTQKNIKLILDAEQTLRIAIR